MNQKSNPFTSMYQVGYPNVTSNGNVQEIEPALVSRVNLFSAIWFEAQTPKTFLEKFRSDPDQFIEQGKELKSGNRCTVRSIDYGDYPFVLKRYNYRNFIHGLRHSVLPSRAKRSWLSAQRLLVAGIPTPKPIACLEQRLGIFRRRSFLLTERVSGETLGEMLLAHKLSQGQMDHLAQQFGTIVNQLDSRSMTHGDLQCKNFLVDDQMKLWIIDLDSTSMHHSKAFFQSARKKDAKRFVKKWQDRPDVIETFGKYL